VAAAFKRLMQARLPKIIFATGDLERNIYKKGEREFWLHSIAKPSREALVNLGFDSDTLALASHEIPADITALVLADPKTELSAETRRRVAQYLDKGGNMLILGEPGKQQMLNPVLRQLGVQLMDGILVELSKDEMPNMVVPYVTGAGADLAQEPALLGLKSIDNEDSLKWLTPGATALAYADSGAFAIKPVLRTVPGRTWLKAGTLVTDSAAPVFSPQEGDIKKDAFPGIVALTRQVNGKEQRIIVGGDADFMSSLRQGGDFVSRAFYSWMDYGAFPIYTPRPKPRDNKLTISPTGAAALKIAYIWVLPGLVLLLATVLLIRRKRK
jgi:ABC-2 type transport system permease protein